MLRRGSRLVRLLGLLVAIVSLAACGAHSSAPRPGGSRAVARAPINARVLAAVAQPVYGPLDGVSLPAAAEGLPVAVVIDNALPARPQYGLAQAEVVYELLVEGGITRFLAVYSHAAVSRIEPVRSVRTPFLRLALELDAVLAHAGAAAEEGPADAVSQMRQWGVHHLEEEAGGVISRDPSRSAPHNAVTSTAAVRAAAGARGWSGPARLSLWHFKEDGGASGAPVTAASLDFDTTGINRGAFAVRWEYDPASNSYLRFQGGAPHRDAGTNTQLRVKNVVIHLAPVIPAGDRSGHLLYQSEGSGRALVLRDGVVTEGTWRTDGPNGRTRYYDESGREIAFNRGATWVEMLPPEAPRRLA